MNEKMKFWKNQHKTELSSLVKMMKEFAQGFETLDELPPCISIFGSARTPTSSPYYKTAVEIARLFSENGYGIITGGGPGIMEAANKGAYQEKGCSVGLCIDLPSEQNSNAYIDPDKQIDFHYFFTRKVMFMKYSQSFIVLPGGLGTLDELFEALTLIQTQKIKKFPIILVGFDYWSGLLNWLKTVVLEKNQNINFEALDLLKILDDPKEIYEVVNQVHCDIGLKENF